MLRELREPGEQRVADHERDQGDQPAGDRRDPAVLQLPPCLSVSLDQHARLTAFYRGVFFLARAHLAPHGGVVVGLRLRALLLGFLLLGRSGERQEQHKREREARKNRDRFHERLLPYSARLYSFCARLRILSADSQLVLSPGFHLEVV